jgi:hypothetical protein
MGAIDPPALSELVSRSATFESEPIANPEGARKARPQTSVPRVYLTLFSPPPNYVCVPAPPGVFEPGAAARRVRGQVTQL